MGIPAKTRQHVLEGLSATPRVLALLASQYPSDHRAWAAGLPDRFTLSDMVAHLADWDLVFLERVEATLASGAIADPDASEVASSRGYATRDPHASIREFAVHRQKVLARLRSLSEADWQKSAVHPRHGAMSVEVQAVHILGHDGYHLNYLSLLLSDQRS